MPILIAGYQVADDVLAAIDRASSTHGIPLNVGRAHVLAESGGNPLASGDAGTSDGLLQLHRPDGQGAGYSRAQLVDAETNLRIGMPYIAAAWRQTGNLSGRARVERTAALSGHPADPQAMHPGSRGYVDAMRGIKRIGDLWEQLEHEQPTAPTETVSLAGIPVDSVRAVIDQGVAFAHAHPALAAAATVAALVVLS